MLNILMNFHRQAKIFNKPFKYLKAKKEKNSVVYENHINVIYLLNAKISIKTLSNIYR